MSEQVFCAKFYWSARRETAMKCGDRIVSLLRSLEKIHPKLGRWEILKSSGERSTIGDEGKQSIVEALEDGQNRDEIDGSVIDELGYRIALSNKHTSLQAAIGGYSAWVSNALILGPLRASRMREICNFGTMWRVAHEMILHADPHHGVVSSEEYDELVYDYEDPEFQIEPQQPRPGWISYIASDYWLLPKPLDVAQYVSIPNRGHLMAVTDDIFTAANKEHVSSANRLWKDLLSAGPAD